MVQYRIQNLLTLLQPRIKPNNPNHDILETEYVAWIDTSPFLNDAHKKAWKRAELPLLMSRVFPDAAQSPLRVSLEYMMAFLMMEQLTDTPASSIEAQKWAEIWNQAWKQSLGEVESGPAVVLKYLVDRVLDAVGEPHKSYLLASNFSLGEGMVKEAIDRESPATELKLESYMKTRRDSLGLRPFLDFGRWMCSIDLSRDVLMHPDIVKLEEQTIDLVALANDLYSYKKEFYESGAHHNYITYALGDSSTGLQKDDRQGAIDYTCRTFSEILADFQRRVEALPSFGNGEDGKIALYVGVMLDLVVGNIQWSLVCARYRHFEKAGTAEAPNWGDVVFDMDPL